MSKMMEDAVVKKRPSHTIPLSLRVIVRVSHYIIV